VLCPADTLMLDTNVFNEVLDGRLADEAFLGRKLIVVGVQSDELSRCKTRSRVQC